MMQDTCFDSTVVSMRKHWRGYNNLKHLVVFGASYCDVGYTSRSPHPTLEQPLGVDFPGNTWAEPGKPNWVGHLAIQRTPSPLLVYDYGLGGDRVDGVRRQVEKEFIPHLGSKPSWAPWTEDDTMFVTWVGINDCGYEKVEAIPGLVSRLFELHAQMYQHGARNFMLVDLPPVERSPSGPSPQKAQRLYADRPPSTAVWNAALRAEAKNFSASHNEATVLIYSSWMTFTKVLDDPTAFGFAQEDVKKAAGSIWVDRLHPTSKMHEIIAQDMTKLLSSVESFKQLELDR